MKFLKNQNQNQTFGVTKTSPKKNAFTLVELLTVIAIIAILMGLLFPTIGAVKESGRKTQAKNDTVQLANAIKNFYTEYGEYPDGLTGSPATLPVEVLEALMGTTAGATINPRRTVFIEVPDAKGRGEVRMGGYYEGKWLDPWGGEYRVAADSDYNNEISNPYTGAGDTTLRTGAIAFSLGKDKAGGSGAKESGTNKDDILSWY